MEEKEKEQELCAVCWEALSTAPQFKLQPCAHVFHTECIQNVFRSNREQLGEQ